MPERTIFRQSALAAYSRSKEKDVVPRLIYWPVVVCLWFLLAVLITAGFLAWFVRIPTYVDGMGIILTPRDLPSSNYKGTEAIMFLPPGQATHLRVGLPVQIQIGATGVDVQGSVAKVEPGITSPAVARQRYHLDGAGALLITQPSTVVIISLGRALSSSTYAGSLCSAKVETGSQHLLALLPGLGQFLGGSS